MYSGDIHVLKKRRSGPYALQFISSKVDMARFLQHQVLLLYNLSTSFWYFCKIPLRLIFCAAVVKPYESISLSFVLLPSCRRILTLAAFHSSSAMTTPSMISIPARPPCLPADCSSFNTMLFNFLSWTRSSIPFPSIPLRAARALRAGSAGTMIAMGFALSSAAYTQMFATTVADR